MEAWISDIIAAYEKSKNNWKEKVKTMARMTVAQLRERELRILVTYKTLNQLKKTIKKREEIWIASIDFVDYAKQIWILQIMKSGVIPLMQREVKKEKLTGTRDLTKYFMIHTAWI